MGTRGRPSLKIVPTPDKFTREYLYEDGIRIIWTYDLTKTKNGPISVEGIYPKDYFKNQKTNKNKTDE